MILCGNEYSQTTKIGDNEQCCELKVQRKNTKIRSKAKIESGAIEECASSADQSHPSCALSCHRESRKIRRNFGK